MLIQELLSLVENNYPTVKVGKMEMFKPVHDLIKDLDIPGGVEAIADSNGQGDIEMTEDQANVVIANAEKAGHKVKKIGKSVYITSKDDKDAFFTLITIM